MRAAQALVRENCERHRTNEIPRKASAADRPVDVGDCRPDRPNALWGSDLTYVSSWCGFVYMAFVIDAFARRIVGWVVSASLRTDLALDALEQALYDQGIGDAPLVYHSDQGV